MSITMADVDYIYKKYLAETDSVRKSNYYENYKKTLDKYYVEFNNKRSGQYSLETGSSGIYNSSNTDGSFIVGSTHSVFGNVGVSMSIAYN